MPSTKVALIFAIWNFAVNNSGNIFAH